MAFIDFFYAYGSDDARFSGTHWIYNVHAPVGFGAPNRHEDVAVVQTLLSGLARGVTGMRPMVIDGKFGPETHKQLLVYQKYVASQGARVVVDGRVDRARGESGSISHCRYSIRYLNEGAHQMCPEYFPALEVPAPNSLPPVLWAVRQRGVTD
ncbi:MAG TPA: peptidoglycan-binding domain-containing protein [Bryobacteraceae bacterium]|nr:peptidoglycan-binding domain-containing protein [Bryobacteraceae bacterium]